jgi:hypothetical protein
MGSVRKIEIRKGPVSRVFFGRFGYKVVFIWFILLLFLVLTSVYYGTLTAITLPFDLPSGVRLLPLFKDIDFYWVLIAVPCQLILLDYFLKAIPDTFMDLWRNKVIQNKTKPGNSIKQYSEQLKILETKINDRESMIFGFVVVTIFLFSSLYFGYKVALTEYSTVKSHDIRFFPLSDIVFHIMTAFFIYLLFAASVKGFFLISLIRRLQEDYIIRIRPVHPDKCGGFKPLGDLCIKFDYAFFIATVFSLFYFFFPQGTGIPAPFLEFLVLIFLSTFLLFYPIWPIHNSIKKQKIDTLSKLNEKLDPIYQEVMIEDSDISVKKLEKIERMDIIYERVSKMSEWPFDIGNWLKYLITILIPLLGIMVTVLDLFFGKS